MQYRRRIIHPYDEYYSATTVAFPPRNSRIFLHVLLFLLTILTTTAVGTLLSEFNPISIPGILQGLSFSVTILLILGIHEFAHYFTARSWGIDVTLPYFIPAPIPPIGTFGAVIKMNSSIPSRRALIDVGASGPIAGFLASVIAGIVGIHLSKIIPASLLQQSDIYYSLGESFIFRLIEFAVLGANATNNEIILHPVAFAAWIGFFVTALNLIPIGQLDGGHILFAISPRIHEFIRKIRLPLLILLGIFFWNGWFIWAILSLFFGRIHPYPDIMERNVGFKRVFIAITAIIIFFACLMLTPVEIA